VKGERKVKREDQEIEEVMVRKEREDQMALRDLLAP